MGVKDNLNVIISMILLLARNLTKMVAFMNFNARDVKAAGMTKPMFFFCLNSDEWIKNKSRVFKLGLTLLLPG